MNDHTQESIKSTETSRTAAHAGGDSAAAAASASASASQNSSITNASWYDYDDPSPWIIPKGAAMIVREIAAERIFVEMVDSVVDDSRHADHQALFNLLRQFPGLCHRTYEIKWESNSKRHLYPLAILCCLKPPLGLVKFVYQTYPPALHHQESVKDTLPFHYACTFQASLEVVDWMINLDPSFLQTPRKDDMYPIHLAVFFKAPRAVVDRLLQAWPEGATRDYSGEWSILHAAAAGQADLDLVRTLYELSPHSILTLDERRRTPLHQACWKTGNLEVVSFLLEKAPPTLFMEDDRGETPLFRAARNQSLQVLQFLLPDDPPLDDMGATLLHFAALDNTVDVVEFLLAKHPDMATRHTMERDGYTPLHSACHFSSNLGTIEALVRHSPELLTELNGHGKTPLETAQEYNKNSEVIEYLERVTPPHFHHRENEGGGGGESNLLQEASEDEDDFDDDADDEIELDTEMSSSDGD